MRFSQTDLARHSHGNYTGAESRHRYLGLRPGIYFGSSELVVHLTVDTSSYPFKKINRISGLNGNRFGRKQ